MARRVEEGVGFPITAVDQFSGAFDKLMGKVGMAQRGFEGLQANILRIATGLGAIGLGAFVKNVIDAHDEVNKLSQKLGISAGELSTFKYAAELSDVSMQSLGAGIKGLSQRMIEAQDATSKAGKLMKSLGVDITGGTLPALTKIADTFAAMPDGPTKSALAVELFGKAGMELIPLLNQGAEGIDKLRVEAEKLGLKMSDETARAAEQFNDNMRAVTASAQALGIELLNNIAPALVRITNEMKAAAMEGGTLKGILQGLRAGFAEIFFGDPDKNRIAAIRKELELLEPMLQEAPELTTRVEALNRELRGLMSFGEVGQAGTAGATAAVNKGLEDKMRKLLGNADAAGKAAKAMKDLGLADAHVTAFLKAQNEELERQAALMGYRAQWEQKQKQAEVDRINIGGEVIDRLKEGNELLQAEIDMLGMTAEARELYLLGLEKQRDLSKDLTPEDEARIKRLYEEREALVLTASQRSQMLDTWQQFGRDLGQGFGQIWDDMLNGRLSSWKGFVDRLGGMFQQTISRMSQQAISQMFSNVGTMMSSGSFSFSGLMQGVNPMGLIGMVSQLAGGLVGNMLGSGPRAQPWQSLGIVGALIGHFIDPDGLAQRGATFGPMAGATGPTQYQYTSPFGTFGLSDTSWFSDADMGAQLTRWMRGMGQWERQVSGFLTPEEIARVTGALGSSTRYGFGEEHGNFDEALSSMTADRANTILGAIDPYLQTLIEGFEGTGEELGQFVITLLSMRKALEDMNITGLDMETLGLMAQAGETLEQTFQRVAGTWAWFTQNFYTEAERLDMATADVNEVFETLGIAVPGSITDFRRLVEGLDLSTESGRAMWNMLMGVAPAFLLVMNAADGATSSTEDLTDALEEQAELQRRIADDVRESRLRQLDAVIGARSGLQDFLNRTMLGGLSILTPEERLAEARRQYEEVLLAAQAGDLTAAGRLGGASQSYLEVARSLFASSGRYVDIFNQVTGDVRSVDDRLAIDQQILEATLGMAATMAEVRDLLIDIRDGNTDNAKRLATTVERAAAPARR